MIKGAQKRMIVFHTEGSRLFDEAFFVLKQDAGQANKSDIVAEANRILDDCVNQQSRPSGRKPFPWRAFSMGMLFGAVCTAVCFFFFR